MIRELHNWPMLETVVSREESTNCNGEVAVKIEYFMSSLDVDARTHSIIVDEHLRIEDNKYDPEEFFVEDGEFMERRGNSYRSYSVLRKLANECSRKFFNEGKSLFERKMAFIFEDNVLFDLIMSFPASYDLEQLCTEFAQIKSKKNRK